MEKNNSNVFIYRRTHIDDPNEDGIFGICDCMGSFRNWEYDAVIGIGGIKPDKGCEDIAKKLTWVGIGPHKDSSAMTKNKTCSGTKKPFRGPRITFKHFWIDNKEGPMLKDCAPLLANYMFCERKIPRAALSKNLPEEIKKELDELVSKYSNYPPSKNSNESNPNPCRN